MLTGKGTDVSEDRSEVIFMPHDKDTTITRNVGNVLPINTNLKLESSAMPL